MKIGIVVFACHKWGENGYMERLKKDWKRED